ncbi:nucleoside triphosphate pyrophosphatase [Paraglaciecola sp. 20A4]|uniref:Maf family protein n=1 Tax=Paraglaciecola sp. 20A4 TaxID=2687288 RepID=UPI00140891A7|nr:nucleoside triphosphate pyrophosphatase [Paraglaciecola sp. 20A4]
MKLILASTSLYRKSLLAKLCIPFTCESPDVDETPSIDEKPEQLVSRLSLAKAADVAARHQGIVIGSDQVACVDGKILGKPANFSNAFKQLTFLSGRTVTFYTGLALFDSQTGKHETMVETFDVSFKDLSSENITRYLEIETPYDCAGSFKSEGLGICLFSSLDGRDPNTLVGLPLIALIELLAKFDVNVFDYIQKN